MKEMPDLVTWVGGTHVVSTPFAISRDWLVLGGTPATVIQIADGTAEANYGAFNITGDYVTVQDLIIDGNKAGQGAYVATPNLVGANAMTGFRACNLHIYDGKGDGIETVNCIDVLINYCHVHDCYQHAVHLNGVTNGIVDNCHLTDDGSTLLTQAHGGIDTVTISHNTLERPGGAAQALGVSANDAPAGMRKHCTVTGNTFILGTNKGIDIADDFDDCTITDNSFDGSAAILITVGNGATNITIENNTGITADQIEWL